MLAEAAPPAALASKAGLEAIALDRPSYAEAVKAAALEEAVPVAPSEANSAERPGKTGGEGVTAELAEPLPPGSPEAIGEESPSKVERAGTAVSLDEAALPGYPEALVGAAPSKAGGSSAAVALDEAAPPGTPESIGEESPSRVEGAGTALSLDEAVPPGTPEAIAYRRSVGPGAVQAALQDPEVPTASESLAALKPQSSEEGAVAELDEPSAVQSTQGAAAPVAIADAQPSPGQEPPAELGEPEVPAPQESLSAEKPEAVEPGQAIAELAEPNAAASPAAAAPETATAVSAEKPALASSPTAELAAPAVPSPAESLSGEKPAMPKPGEAIVALEPAEPRPPQTANVAPAAESKPAQPAAVATVRGPSPSGAAEPPASIPILKGLAKGSFYVQIGVYGTNDSLKSAIAGFKSTYPLAVERLPTKAGAAYRLFVGPLSRDESGVVLIRIRSLGFRDAYVRQGS